MTYQQRIPISTSGHGDMCDLTQPVAAARCLLRRPRTRIVVLTVIGL